MDDTKVTEPGWKPPGTAEPAGGEGRVVVVDDGGLALVVVECCALVEPPHPAALNVRPSSKTAADRRLLLRKALTPHHVAVDPWLVFSNVAHSRSSPLKRRRSNSPAEPVLVELFQSSLHFHFGRIHPGRGDSSSSTPGTQDH